MEHNITTPTSAVQEAGAGPAGTVLTMEAETLGREAAVVEVQQPVPYAVAPPVRRLLASYCAVSCTPPGSVIAAI